MKTAIHLDGKTITEPVTEFPKELWRKIRGAVGEISIDTNPTKTKRKRIAKFGMVVGGVIAIDRAIMAIMRRKNHN